MLHLFFLLACSGEPAPEAAPEALPPPLPTAEPDTPPAPPEATTLPPGTPSGGPKVSVIGYGVRLTLNPPFQVAKLGDPAQGQEETIIVAWWDVNAPGAGQQGRAGLYNISLVPGNPTPTGPIAPAVGELKGEPLHLLRRGEDGAEIRFPRGISGLGGLGELTAGPEDARWAIQIDGGDPIPFANEREMLHSWDPTTGEAARFELMPVRPWGPWKTPDAPAPAPAPEAPRD